MMKTVLFASVFALIPITACSQAATDKAPATAEQAASSSSQVVSNADFATTNARLRAAIESRGLTLFNTIDHAAGAAKVDLELAPNTLYIFGNPKAGTPLMIANPDMGLHLPLKANIREQGGQVIVAVSDIRALASEPAPVVNKIAETLAAIQAEAAGQ